MNNNQKDFFDGKIVIKVETEEQCKKLIQTSDEVGFNTEFADIDDYIEFGYMIIDEDGDCTAVNETYINYVSSKRNLRVMLFNEVFTE